MKKTLFSLALASVSLWSMAQSTSRNFVLKNSTDGESEITVYLPSAEKAASANGRAVVDCPGGGYSHLAMDHEGHDWAEFYNAQGIAYVVLKYRMPKGDRNIPLGDAYQAIRTVRDSALVWNVNPHNVGIQGFSAGGHLASAVSTHAPMDARPDFSILFYPVISMNEKESHKGSCVGFLGEQRNDESVQKEWSSNKAVRRHITPPAIVIMANDDEVVPPATNGAAYYNSMRKSGNQCAMFCYPTGGHGFGFRSSWRYHDLMLMELTQWLSDLQMPKAQSVKVACVGNSITDGAGIDMCDVKGYPAVLGRLMGDGYAVKNFGVSGRTMANSGNRPYQKEQSWRDCLDWNPDVVVIKLGTNDTKTVNWEGKAEHDFIPSLQQMIDSLNARPKAPRIVLCTPIPAFQEEWTIRDSIIVAGVIPQLTQYATEQNLELIDFYTPFKNADKQGWMSSDKIHPNAKGAAEMAKIVAEQLRKDPPAPVKGKKAKKSKKK